MIYVALATKLENYKKNAFMIYAYVIHTWLDVALATKLENYKKNVFMIYAYVIHTCLDVALMEEDLYPSVISASLCKFRKYSPTDWA